jgi:ketosteroid isomerase-like protein
MADVVEADLEGIRAANTGFYRAFESLSLRKMEPVWSHGDHVACVHPGWQRLVGWDAVRESWDAIFRNTREMRFTLTEIQVEVRGDIGWVLCTENILSEARGNLSVTAILATNIFERHGRDWLMVHHHASHVLATSASPAPDSA